MTDAEKSAHIKEAYDLLKRVEAAHPNSPALKALHAKLKELLDLYIVDNSGVIRPDLGGTPK